MEKFFPTCLIVLDICAAVGYVPTGDWRRVIYPPSRGRHSAALRRAGGWLAAATLTTVITW